MGYNEDRSPLGILQRPVMGLFAMSIALRKTPLVFGYAVIGSQSEATRLLGGGSSQRTVGETSIIGMGAITAPAWFLRLREKRKKKANGLHAPRPTQLSN